MTSNHGAGECTGGCTNDDLGIIGIPPGRHLDGEEGAEVICGTGDATTAKNHSNAAHESAGYAA